MLAPNNTWMWFLLLLPLLAAPLPAHGQGAEANPASVLLVEPTGPVVSATAVHLIFDKPIVPNSRVGLRTGKGPIQTRPRLDGTFVWIGRSCLRFEFDEPRTEAGVVEFEFDPDHEWTRKTTFNGPLSWSFEVVGTGNLEVVGTGNLDENSGAEAGNDIETRATGPGGKRENGPDDGTRNDGTDPSRTEGARIVAEADASADAAAPAPARSHLAFRPDNAMLLRGRGGPLRVEATSLDTVTVRARWIESADAARHWADPSWTPPGEDGFFEEDWATELRPELQSRRIRLPAERGAALWLEAESAALSARTALQWSSVSATTLFGGRHGLVWVTSLESGAPVADAHVALVSLPDTPTEDGTATSREIVWEGRTDAEGLVWCPGHSVFPETGVPDLLRVTVDAQDTWFPLETPAVDSHGGERAFLWTDRTRYSSEDIVHWSLWSFQRSDRQLVPAADTLELRLFGPRSAQRHEVRVDELGRAHGQLPLPRTTGRARMEVRNPKTGQTLVTRLLEIQADDPPQLRLEAVAGSRRVTGNDPIELTARATNPAAGPVSRIPTRWTVEEDVVEPWAPPGEFAHFHFSSAAVGPQNGRGQVDGEDRTDEDGVATAEWRNVDTTNAQSRRIRVTTQAPASFADSKAEFEFLWFRSPLQVGLRDLSDEAGYRGSLAWEWIVVDTDGNSVADVPVVAELLKLQTGAEPQRVWKRDLVSGEERQVVAVERPGPGSFSLRLRTGEDSGGVTVAAGGPEADGETDGTAGGASLSIRRSGTNLVEVTLPATPASGAHTLFTIEQDEVMAARSTFVPSSGVVELPLPPLPPPSAQLRVTQVGSAPPDSEESGRSPALFEGFAPVQTDDPRLRCRLDLEVEADGDSLDLSVRLLDFDGRPARGTIAVALAALGEAVTSESAQGERVDPVASLFAKSGTGPRFVEPRRRLPQSRKKTGIAPSTSDATTLLADGSETEAASPRQGPNSRQIAERPLWTRTGLAVRADHPERLRLPAAAHSRLRLQILGQTDELGMALLDTVLVADGLRLFLPSPGVLRIGDEIELPLRVENLSPTAFAGRLEVTTQGGSCRVSDERIEIEANGSTSTTLPLHSIDAELLVVSLRVVDEDGIPAARFSKSIPVANEIYRDRTGRSGTVAPRAAEELELNEPWILSGGSLYLDLAPSYFLELRDALVDVSQGRLPGVGAEIARLEAFALISARRAWFDENPRPEEQANLALNRLRAAGLPRSLGAHIPQTDLTDPGWAQRFYQDAWALRAIKRAAASGIEIDRPWQRDLEIAVRDFHRRTEDSQSRAVLDLAALLYWVRAENGDRQLDEELFGWLLSRDGRFGRHGRLWASLALSTWSRDSLPAPLANPVASKIRSMIAEIDEDVPTDLPSALWRDSIELTSDALLLLARSRPNHRLIPVFLRGLLASREDGRIWTNPRQAMSACTALNEVLQVLEDPTRTPGGQLVLGVSNPRRFIFEEETPVVRFEWTTGELARIRRKDPGSTRLNLAFETRRLGRMHYQLWTESEESALTSPARDLGIGLDRRYRSVLPSSNDEIKDRRQRVSHPWIEIEIWVALPERVDGLLIEDPLPPHTQVWPPAEKAPGTRFEVLPNSVRWTTGPIEAGLHRLSYRIMAPGDGRFRVPGTRSRTSDLQGEVSRGTATELTVAAKD